MIKKTLNQFKKTVLVLCSLAVLTPSISYANTGSFGQDDNSTDIATYAYDAFGRRIAKTVHGSTTYYIYSGNQLIAELDESGEMVKAYGWDLNDESNSPPLWQAEVTDGRLDTAEYHTLINDHLGTPQMAVNDEGDVTWRAVSESFGKTIPHQQNQITMNLRFPGQYYDEETGTHYNYFRDYNPVTGRYIQKDPIGLEGGINWSAYAEGNPLIYFDNLGLKVYVCSRPVDIDYIPTTASENFMPWHEWIKTDSKEGGLGGDCPVPGQQCSDVPYVTETRVTDHSGQSNSSNSVCMEAIEVDEDCVNRLLTIGERRGRWTPFNQCQSYVSEIITACRKSTHPINCIGSCHGINY